MPGGLLDRGATAEVKMASGERGGATGGSGTLQHQDPCAGGGRTHGCTAASDTEADYHDVDVVRPRRHVVSAESCWYFSTHWRRSSSSLRSASSPARLTGAAPA